MHQRNVDEGHNEADEDREQHDPFGGNDVGESTSIRCLSHGSHRIIPAVLNVLRQSVEDGEAVSENITCGVLIRNWGCAVGDCGGCLALDGISFLFRASFDADTIGKDVPDVSWVNCSGNVVNVEMIVFLVSFSEATDVVIAIDWSDKLPRISVDVANDGARNHSSNSS